jgi:hypothetical protein
MEDSSDQLVLPSSEVTLSQEETQKLLRILRNKRFMDLLDSGQFSADEKRFDFAVIFSQSHEPKDENFGEILDNFSNHKLVTSSPFSLPRFNVEVIHEFCNSLNTPWPRKMPSVHDPLGLMKESMVNATLIKRHYQDLRSVHKILISIIKEIDFENNKNLWILVEKLLIHIAAAARELVEKRKELAIENPNVRRFYAIAQEKSSDEINKGLWALSLANVNDNSRSSRNSRISKEHKVWTPKKELKASRGVESGAKRV